ncbi:uncharacterized protein ACLA_016800 [Aspergillus clavatus NRRL 1]|uniref:BTB domain-containing protein n=1 Tax=Aspergillus clavatus (strain ATCC 1007 / CBS 513.65 / DSM 816 / NCTC 3887 / NRRL 1 / QM 1276 / 107) TaxID=344612 RepID=A1CBW6_ASPCL|nr:uncharacterized protein ACLA_016800 [Aspergillus clavatus NRRL 1]EAW13234.1 conserved hypothetical protein [Aspergillus clavatus NRRL 1]
MKQPTHIIDPSGEVTIRLLNPNAPFAVSDNEDYNEDENIPPWLSSDQWSPLSNEEAVNALLDLSFLQDETSSAASSPNSRSPSSYKMRTVSLRHTRRANGEYKSQNHEANNKKDSHEITYQVSASHLILASPVLRKALTDGRKDASALSSYNTTSITVYNWGPDSLLLFLNIIHGRHRCLPWQVGLEMLAKVTVIADCYQCIGAVQFMALSWYAFLKPQCLMIDKPRAIVLWLWVTWVLRLPEQFREAAAVAMRQLAERIDPLGLPIPKRIIDAINFQEGFAGSVTVENRQLFWWLYNGGREDDVISLLGCRS